MHRGCGEDRNNLDIADSRLSPLPGENTFSCVCRFAGSGSSQQGLGQAKAAELKLLFPRCCQTPKDNQEVGCCSLAMMPLFYSHLRGCSGSPAVVSGLHRTTALKMELDHLMQMNEFPLFQPYQTLDQGRTRQGQEQPPEQPEPLPWSLSAA